MSKEYYQRTVQAGTLEKDKLETKNTQISFIRLLTFFAFVFTCILVFDLYGWYTLLPAALFLFLFRIVLQAHEKVRCRIEYLNMLLELNRNELEGLEGNYSVFQSGAEYVDPLHPYTSDLDIFGDHSVFQFLNRTTSKLGADLLAGWLKKTAPDEMIRERQQAAKELAPEAEWRQNFAVMGTFHKIINRDLERFYDWLLASPVFSIPGFLNALLYLLPVLTIGAAISLAIWFHPGIPLLFLLIQILIVRRYSKRASLLHAQLTRFSGFILSYSGLIKCIEDKPFHSARLSFLQKKITETSGEHLLASGSLKSLASLLAAFDIRRIPLFHWVLNYLFFWDIHQMIKLERWKSGNRDFIPGWIEAVSEFEVIACFANCADNYPGWCWPELGADYFYMHMSRGGHPLIAPAKRVDNSLDINGKGEIILITGSNMSGKSTFLRTLGINSILAMAGAPACAEAFSISNCLIYTSLRVGDSLSEGTSSFYAELKRLETLISLSKEGKPVFFLLDEILRGTNSLDRYTGSKALIRQFIKNKTSGLLASHDLALADLEQLTPALKNYSFDVQVEGSELFFDYTLHAGRCTSLNASLLMKKIGIDLED